MKLASRSALRVRSRNGHTAACRILGRHLTCTPTLEKTSLSHLKGITSYTTLVTWHMVQVTAESAVRLNQGQPVVEYPFRAQNNYFRLVQENYYMFWPIFLII
jgi:hypothetical protein